MSGGWGFIDEMMVPSVNHIRQLMSHQRNVVPGDQSCQAVDAFSGLPHVNIVCVLLNSMCVISIFKLLMLYYLTIN
jgi:hypothetical protein